MFELVFSCPPLPPLQAGVAVSNTVQFLSLTMQECFERCSENPDLGILLIDITNAFNTVSRQRILETISKRFPLAKAQTSFTLSKSSYLFCGDATLFSTRGVQQGDPLCPLFFVCGIQQAIEAVKEFLNAFRVFI